MRFYGDVIARRGKKYWIGKIKRGKFHPNEELDSLKTLDKLEIKYLTLPEYAKIIGLGLNNKELTEIRKKTGYTEIWVIDQEGPKPSKTTNDLKSERWEKWFFKFFNVLCQTCKKSCKQSSRVELLVCPLYEKKEEDK